ncbi:MAG: tRNA lysidine(34) synthetase TilS [Gammaproteobacteria bacterium]|nr:tRNA lysidine(34) synthetase TilS [Gammaproteobacteria bacterium]
MSPIEESLIGLSSGRSFSRLLVGYSGGLDSTVLLRATRVACPEVPLVAIHVNHGLQKQSHDWEDHCAAVCSALEVELLTCRLQLDAGGNLEATARAARYRFFADQLEADDLLLLAHHRDDQAETVLLRLFQGRGLIGMPLERALGGGRLLRPFLDIPREAIEEYARRHDLGWVEDPSNSDDSLNRNYLRERVLPVLRKRWPAVAVSLSDLAGRHRQRDAALGVLAGLDGRGLELELSTLEQHPVAVQVELLRVWLAGLDEHRATFRALRNFLDQLGSAPHRQPRLDLRSGTLRRFRGVLCYVPDYVMPEAEYSLTAPGSVTLPHGELRVLAAEKRGFSISGELRIVFRRGGEQILVRGTHRSVKKILQNEGIPPWLRDRYPLIRDDDGLLAIGNLLYRDVDSALRAGKRLWRVDWTDK